MESNQARLRAFIAENNQALFRQLRLFVIRAGYQPDPLATELLSEVTVEALAHAERFEAARHPMSWLLGIGANLLRRRIADHARRNQREPLARDLYTDVEDAMSDGELFDWIVANTNNTQTDDKVNLLLADLSPEEGRIVRLAIIHNLSSETVAEALGINPGAARMRLHRALRRLRAAHQVAD